jgi:hypothetical protein
MKLHFWHRRGLRDFADAIRAELRALPTPEPDDDLLQRILASRAAGTRIILPHSSRHRQPIGLRFMAVAVGAALLLVAVPVVRQTLRKPDDVAIASSFFGSTAFAQAPSGTATPALLPIQVTRPNTIRPLVLELERRVHDSSGKSTSNLKATLTITADIVEGTPAWRVTSVDHKPTTTQDRMSVETLYVARADLRLLRRAVHVSPYSRFQRINVGQQFDGDSVSGRMTTDGPSIGAGRTIARSLPSHFGPYLADAMAPLFLMAVPLSAGWTGSASLMGWAVKDEDVFVPIELRVEGEERVRVPAGEFDCWRLSIEFAGRKLKYWARKSDGLGVRTLDDSETPIRGTREVVLRSVR